MNAWPIKSSENTIDSGCATHSTNTVTPTVSQSPVLITHVTRLDEFDQLKDAWQHLFGITADAGMFNSWDWNRLWWQHYGGAHDLFILTAHLDGEMVGIAPFYINHARAFRIKSIHTLQFIGSGGDTSPDDLRLLCRPEHESVVANAVSRHILDIPSLARVALCDMPSGSALQFAFVDQAASAGWTKPKITEHKRRIDDLPQSLDQYLSGLSKNARKQRKRRFQKLEKSGDAQFIRCTTDSCIEHAFASLVELHHKRQSSKGEGGSFSSDAYNAFHLALMQRALARDELRVVQLVLDGQVIGVEYAFQVNGVLALFQTGFDPEYKHLSPGHLMMMHMIESAIAEGATRFDTLKGDYDYKATYAKQWQQTVSIETYQGLCTAALAALSKRLPI